MIRRMSPPSLYLLECWESPRDVWWEWGWKGSDKALESLRKNLLLQVPVVTLIFRDSYKTQNGI